MQHQSVSEEKQYTFKQILPHIAAPIITAGGKTAALFFLAKRFSYSHAICGVFAVPLGLCIGVVQYRYVSVSAAKANADMIFIQKSDMPLTLKEQGKVFICVLSSIGTGFTQAFKVYTVTRRIELAIPSFCLAQASDLHAHGQKWLSETGKDINHSFAGKAAKILILDFELIRYYLIDTKSIAAHLLPAFEASIQVATIFTLAELLDINNPFAIALTAYCSLYSQYYIHSNFGKKIMQLNMENAISMLAGIAKLAASIAEPLITCVLDIVSILTSPMAIMILMNTLAGACMGYTLFAKGLEDLSKNDVKAFGVESIPIWAAGIFGAIANQFCVFPQLKSAWDKTVMLKPSATETVVAVKIGVKPEMEKRFGKSSSITTRATSYLDYASKSASRFAGCASEYATYYCSYFKSSVPAKETVEPLLTPRPLMRLDDTQP